MNNTKLYISIVTLSIHDNMKVLKNIKQGFKRTISWKKCRSEIKTKTKKNNLDYLIDQHLEVLIGCLHFRSKMVMMFLREILFMSITCH